MAETRLESRLREKEQTKHVPRYGAVDVRPRMTSR
jgi:hypothetical protein